VAQRKDGRQHGKQSLDTRKSQRRAKLNGGAAAFLGGDMNGSLEAIEDGSNDIHANATAGDFCDFGSGTKSGLENEIERFLIGQAPSLVGFRRPSPGRERAGQLDPCRGHRRGLR